MKTVVPTIMTLAVAATAAAAAVARPAEGRLTVAAYRQHANAICATERREAMAAYSRTRTFAQYMSSEVTLVQHALASLRKLAPPARLTSVHARVISTIESELALFTVAEHEAAEGKLTDLEWKRNTHGQRLADRERALWNKVGAATCAV